MAYLAWRNVICYDTCTFMRIGIDVQASQGRLTGLGVYTKNLAKSLLDAHQNGFEFHLFKKEQSGDWNTFRRLYWENADLPKRAKKERIELLHVPAFSPPRLKPCKLVATVHDLIGMIFPNQKGWPSRFYWGRWLPESLRGADALIADSENTKKDLLLHVRFPEKKIWVIYPSGHEGFEPLHDHSAARFIRERFAIEEKYFIAVGTLEPRKNLLRVIEAFLNFCTRKARDSKYHLVIVGAMDFAHGEFLKEILKKFALQSLPIVFTGYLEKEDLKLLYSYAQALLFPSLYEGFGIPVLEAMACGAAVLTSKTSSLPEVAGDAALFVDPESVDEIERGIELLAEDQKLRTELVAKGFERIKKFSWRETARQTLKVYESLDG